MEYIEFARPHGRQITNSINLDDRSETLYMRCIEHPHGDSFTYEDCGTFINLCFVAQVNVSEAGNPRKQFERMDVVCEVVPHEDMLDPKRKLDAWAMTVAKAADYLQIHIP